MTKQKRKSTTTKKVDVVKDIDTEEVEEIEEEEFEEVEEIEEEEVVVEDDDEESEDEVCKSRQRPLPTAACRFGRRVTANNQRDWKRGL